MVVGVTSRDIKVNVTVYAVVHVRRRLLGAVKRLAAAEKRRRHGARNLHA